MKTKSTNIGPKIALYGVSRIALYLGRACALRDNPLVGIYHPNPQEGLKAGLFLGVSALHSAEQLARQNPDVVICSERMEPDTSAQFANSLVLFINLERDDTESLNECRVDFESSEKDETPLKIISELPALTYRLDGSPWSEKKALEFFKGLSTQLHFKQN